MKADEALDTLIIRELLLDKIVSAIGGSSAASAIVCQ